MPSAIFRHTNIPLREGFRRNSQAAGEAGDVFLPHHDLQAPAAVPAAQAVNLAPDFISKGVDNTIELFVGERELCLEVVPKCLVSTRVFLGLAADAGKLVDNIFLVGHTSPIR